MLITFAAAAWAGDHYGGVGLVLHDERIAFYDPGTAWVEQEDQELVCVGGQGFRADRGTRQGGEVHLCGNDGPFLAIGGPQYGVITHGGGFYGSLHASVGAGGYTVADRYGGVLLYFKPTAAAAWAPGPFAIELGAYVMLPLEIVTWSNAGTVLGPGVPHVGAQLSVLFGRFDERFSDVRFEVPEGAEVR
jgi:hypothetical protein